MKKSVILSLFLSMILSLYLTGCSQASNEQLQTKEALKKGSSVVTVKQKQTW